MEKYIFKQEPWNPMYKEGIQESEVFKHIKINAIGPLINKEVTIKEYTLLKDLLENMDRKYRNRIQYI
jgi:hypothetical protein